MRPIKKGSTDQSVVIRIIDSGDGTPEQAVEHNSSGISLWYRREGGSVTAITPAALAAANSAHSDGGIEHLDDGYYRLDSPDAAFATGANGVAFGGVVDGMVIVGCYVHLTDYDPQDAVRLGLTALPNAAADAAGGLPISDAGGLDLDAKLANTNEVTAARMGALTDWIDGGRLDLILDARASQASLDALDNIIDTEFGDLVTEVGKIPKSDGTATWNATALASIQSEANDALVANNLDHLVLSAVDTNFATTVHANSVIGHLADNGAGFDRTTDSLEAIRDRGDAAWITATGFSTHSAADVWAAGTRTLTAIDEDSTTLDLDATIRAAVGMNSANLDTQLTAIDDAVDTEIAGLVTSVGAIWTTALTEAYRSDGSTGTGAQLLYELLAHHNEVSISSVTKTTKKIDGSTTAATYTLDDDTAPTSITRAS